MKLTLGYSRVSLFEAPIQRVGPEEKMLTSDEGEEECHDVTQVFRVGPFDYKIHFNCNGGGFYEVSFQLWKINLSGQKLVDVLNKIFERKFSFTIEQAEKINEYPRLSGSSKSFDILGVGNAPQVLGNVMNLVSDFVEEYKPKVILFSADDRKSRRQSRSRVYEMLFKKFFPQAQIEKSFSEGWYSFTITFPEAG